MLLTTLAAAALTLAPVAAPAQPGTDACTTAQSAAAAALAPVLELNPNVFPRDMVPAPAALTVPFLTGVLADPDLGAGGAEEVQAAIDALQARDLACAPDPVTPGPDPDPQEVALAQLCLATGIDDVDATLDDLTGSDLVDQLSGLVDIVVIDDADNVELSGTMQLDDVRRALNCDPADGDGSVTPTLPPGDDGQIGGDGDGGSSVIPDGAPQTGGRPPADTPVPLILAALLAPFALAAQIRRARA